MFKKYCDVSNYIILNYFFILLLLFSFFFFFFYFKKCPDVSNYAILVYSVIIPLFLSFFFFRFKNCQNIINYFYLLIYLELFLVSSSSYFYINQSNHFLIIGLIFFIFCSSNLSISSLDIITGIRKSSSIALLVFSFSIFQCSTL